MALLEPPRGFSAVTVIAAPAAVISTPRGLRTTLVRLSVESLIGGNQNGMEVEMRSSTMILLSAVVGVLLVLVASTRNEAAPTAIPEPAIAAAAAPPINPIRALTSPSCSSDGCPLSCSPKESLVSAICVGVTGAKFSDAIRVDDGVMTATCSSSTNSIVVLCALK
jgi:hypothetical protein